MLKRTPLHSAHQRLGARLAEFGGWEMPIQYAGIIEEHLAVRRAAGIFDISHMGEVRIHGTGAPGFLNHVLTNDISRLEVGQGQYTLLCNERGGTVDDLYAYRTGADDYLLVINASRIDSDVAWLKAAWETSPHRAQVQVEDVSASMGAIAVQGPAVMSFIDRSVPGPSVAGTPTGSASGLRKNQVAGFPFAGATVWVARTGYTGEDGFELVASASVIEGLWTILLQDGERQGLAPCGLGARDTLRTEMGYPLYGHELDEETSPLEAGLGAFVALEKGDFIGRDALVAQKTVGVARRCVAFKMTDRSAPPRPQYPIWSVEPEVAVGKVVSGTQSPSLGVGIGLGYVPPALAKPGTLLHIEIRGRRALAVVVAKPIYRKPV
jgi:aminomethyltransferase